MKILGHKNTKHNIIFENNLEEIYDEEGEYQDTEVTGVILICKNCNTNLIISNYSERNILDACLNPRISIQFEELLDIRNTVENYFMGWQCTNDSHEDKVLCRLCIDTCICEN